MDPVRRLSTPWLKTTWSSGVHCLGSSFTRTLPEMLSPSPASSGTGSPTTDITLHSSVPRTPPYRTTELSEFHLWPRHFHRSPARLSSPIRHWWTTPFPEITSESGFATLPTHHLSILQARAVTSPKASSCVLTAAAETAATLSFFVSVLVRSDTF